MRTYNPNPRSDSSGFTLIELMVVVLIIAVLIAIAVPSFLGMRTAAMDRSTQTDLRNVLLAMKAVVADDRPYNAVHVGVDANATAFEIQPIEEYEVSVTMRWIGDLSSGNDLNDDGNATILDPTDMDERIYYFSAPDSQTFTTWAVSGSQRVFCIREVRSLGTFYDVAVDNGVTMAGIYGFGNMDAADGSECNATQDSFITP